MAAPIIIGHIDHHRSRQGPRDLSPGRILLVAAAMDFTTALATATDVPNRAKVAESVDALVLGASGATRESSSLSFRTNIATQCLTPQTREPPLAVTAHISANCFKCIYL